MSRERYTAMDIIRGDGPETYTREGQMKTLKMR